MNPQSFHGVFTAIVTPFQKDLSIDWSAFEKLLQNQIKGGVTGIVPCGTTGESPTLSSEEKIEVIKRTVAAAKGKCLVMAGTGSNNTQETIAFSKKACELGADALLVVVPYYNKPSQAGLENHFRSIADAVSKPIFLYNVPGRTITSLSAETIGRLATHPNIIGIKEATGNLAFLTEVRNAVKLKTNKQFVYLTGDDPTLVPFLTSGGNGVISVASNILPAEMVEICKDVVGKKYEKALETYEELHNFFNNLFIEANPVPCKAVLSWLGLCQSTVRAPLSEISEDNSKKLKTIWEKLPARYKK